MKAAKTAENDASVEEFLKANLDERQREESLQILEIFKKISPDSPRMWGDSIVGFGHYTYKYASGHEDEWMRGGFSPRKGKFSIYIMNGFDDYGSLLAKLGKYKTGKSCLYIRRLEDIDLEVLESLIAGSFNFMAKKYPL